MLMAIAHIIRFVIYTKITKWRTFLGIFFSFSEKFLTFDYHFPVLKVTKMNKKNFSNVFRECVSLRLTTFISIYINSLVRDDEPNIHVFSVPFLNLINFSLQFSPNLPFHRTKESKVQKVFFMKETCNFCMTNHRLVSMINREEPGGAVG